MVDTARQLSTQRFIDIIGGVAAVEIAWIDHAYVTPRLRGTLTFVTYSHQHPHWERALQGSGIDFVKLELEIDDLYSHRSSVSTSRPRVYPKRSLVFRAFHELGPDDVRVVVLGQDPYPQPDVANPATGIADGLAFSARGEPPRSLRHILYNLWISGEIINPPRDADLQPWTAKGVLLLNSALSVEPHSDKVVAEENRRRHLKVYRGLISATLAYLSGPLGPDPAFLLLGKDARRFGNEIQNSKSDQVIGLRHPALDPWPEPGGEQLPFTRMNTYLGDRAIDWQL